MADIEQPIDVGRITHLYVMHRTEDDDGDPVPAGFLLAADGSLGHTWTDPTGIVADTADLDAAVFDTQNHNTLGSAETFSVLTAGWHYGTLDQDCTFALTARASGVQS